MGLYLYRAGKKAAHFGVYAIPMVALGVVAYFGLRDRSVIQGAEDAYQHALLLYRGATDAIRIGKTAGDTADDIVKTASAAVDIVGNNIPSVHIGAGNGVEIDDNNIHGSIGIVSTDLQIHRWSGNFVPSNRKIANSDLKLVVSTYYPVQGEVTLRVDVPLSTVINRMKEYYKFNDSFSSAIAGFVNTGADALNYNVHASIDIPLIWNDISIASTDNSGETLQWTNDAFGLKKYNIENTGGEHRIMIAGVPLRLDSSTKFSGTVIDRISYNVSGVNDGTARMDVDIYAHSKLDDPIVAIGQVVGTQPDGHQLVAALESLANNGSTVYFNNHSATFYRDNSGDTWEEKFIGKLSTSLDNINPTTAVSRIIGVMAGDTYGSDVMSFLTPAVNGAGVYFEGVPHTNIAPAGSISSGNNSHLVTRWRMDIENKGQQAVASLLGQWVSKSSPYVAQHVIPATISAANNYRQGDAHPPQITGIEGDETVYGVLQFSVKATEPSFFGTYSGNTLEEIDPDLIPHPKNVSIEMIPGTIADSVVRSYNPDTDGLFADYVRSHVARSGLNNVSDGYLQNFVLAYKVSYDTTSTSEQGGQK